MHSPDPAEVSSATPLNALGAVALDTETTGLAAGSARLIQIGAVRLARSRLIRDDTWSALVNPGVPIPPESTGIHGLTDADVAQAPGFAELQADFERWIGRAIVIGYSIGFDLAILKREHELANLPWRAPRTIDVRHLVTILAPRLPDYSLDTTASWLGIGVHDRHQALGDAVMAAEAFVALAPRLTDKGIRTLAELEQACRGLHHEAPVEARAGWYDFLHSGRDDDAARREMARIDSYPYRHRVRDVMRSPPRIVDAGTSVAETLALLMREGIGSAFVRESGAAGPGIVTQGDVLRAVDRHAADALARPIGEFARFPLETVAADAFLYRALGRMRRRRFRHLGVHDGQGSVVGVLSSRDLLEQRADDALDLGEEIEHARVPEDLGVAWAKLALVATGLDGEGVDARDVAAVISRELRGLTRRACQLAEREMEAQGFGPPPAPYAMLVLGSGGRGESLLAMDQDNAIVHAEGEPEGEEDRWFARLGARVAGMLHHSGVPLCRGGIMARNPQWRMSALRWKQRIDTWIRRTSPQDLMNTDIFFDAVAVHGDRALARDVLGYAMQAGSASREFLHLLAHNAADVHVPLGMFDRFRLRDGRMDVKMGGILPIVSAARVEAIRHRIDARATPARLEAVKRITGAHEEVFDNLIEAHRIILRVILKQQLYDLDHGIALSNKVAPDRMKPALRNGLRWALRQVPAVTDVLDVPLR